MKNFATAVLVAAICASGCSSMSRSARAERTYRNYVQKQKTSRDRLRAQMRQSRSAIPQAAPEQSPETNVTTQSDDVTP